MAESPYSTTNADRCPVTEYYITILAQVGVLRKSITINEDWSTVYRSNVPLQHDYRRMESREVLICILDDASF